MEKASSETDQGTYRDVLETSKSHPCEGEGRKEVEQFDYGSHCMCF